MFICVLYCPPNSDTSIYTSLSENMDQLLSSHPNSLFLICGDFNCHHASWRGVGTSLTCHGTSAKDFCDSLGLTQSVNFPNRISTNGTLSLLDLILTNFPENICCSSSTPIGSSDHVLVKNRAAGLPAAIQTSIYPCGRFTSRDTNLHIPERPVHQPR